MDLTAGFKVTVIDTSDPDWWKGKCLGRVGYFPSKYVARLQAGERPLQVLQNLQISDGDKNGSMTLLRDQIVVQVRICDLFKYLCFFLLSERKLDRKSSFVFFLVRR